MIIKNVSGETRYFGFGRGTRGRSMANNGTSTVPDNDPYIAGLVQHYVAQGQLQIVEGPAEATLSASINTPAFAYIEANGAVADADTVVIAGVTYEFANDPGAAVLGEYNSGLSNAAFKWAGDGAAAVTAIATLRTAINHNSATSGLVADAAVQYDTGKYLLPIRRADGSPSAAGSFVIDATGANLAKSSGGLIAGITGAALKTVIKKHTVVAGDVTNAAILVATGLTSITTVQVQVVAATGIEKAWNGAALVSGGNIILNNVGTVDWADTDVVTVTATGA